VFCICKYMYCIYVFITRVLESVFLPALMGLTSTLDSYCTHANTPTLFPAQ
jgi:hypothetical protein